VLEAELAIDPAHHRVKTTEGGLVFDRLVVAVRRARAA